jgi:phage minor structural protein
VPCKYVYFVEELERDNGLSFEYGIDLKTITRSIDSDKLATKIIVNPNNNEFADNGFCSIARSSENYSKENFILNLDYFI